MDGATRCRRTTTRCSSSISTVGKPRAIPPEHPPASSPFPSTERNVLTQHRPRGVHGQTVESLAAGILSNEYAEGSVLDLPALQQELDVSLTALREALKVLTAKGLID